MKLYSKISFLAAVLTAATAFAAADTLQLGSYGTGQSSMGNANSAMNYAGFNASSTTPSVGSGSTYFLDPSTVWEAAVPNSTWIGSTSTSGPVGTVNLPWGYYTFTTTFTANGVYSGSIDVQADDTTEVLLNGVVIVPFGALGTDIHCADNVPNCSSQDTVGISDALLSGTNTLTFIVQQHGDETPGLDPSGVDFDATLNQVPEPGSLLLLGTGLIGAAGETFRRMRVRS